METFSTRRGYTLMELVTVLGIIALLLAILLPTLSMAKGRARQSVCADNLRQLHLAFAMYAGDHDGFLPPYNNSILFAHDSQPDSDRHKKHYPSNNQVLTNSLAPYIHSSAVWFCPDDPLANKAAQLSAYPAGLFIDHQYGSYETGWWVGLIRFPARIDGLSMTDMTGKPVEMNPANEALLNDEEIEKTGCGDWLYSHHNQFNFLFLDGHVNSGGVTCEP